MSRPRPTQARARRTVQRILDAARELLGRDGPAGFTTNHVAQEAGIAVGTLYGHFRSKEAIAEALVSELAEVEAEALTTELRARWDAPTHEVVEAVSRRLLQLFRAHGPAVRAAWAVLPRERHRGQRPSERALVAEVDRWLAHRSLRSGPHDALLLFHLVEGLGERLAMLPIDDDQSVALLARAIHGALAPPPADEPSGPPAP